MSDTSRVLSLPLIQPSQAQKYVTHNEAIDVGNALVQAAVQSADQSTPPAMPTSGAMYIVDVYPTGGWVVQENARCGTRTTLGGFSHQEKAGVSGLRIPARCWFAGRVCGRR